MEQLLFDIQDGKMGANELGAFGNISTINANQLGRLELTLSTIAVSESTAHSLFKHDVVVAGCR